MSYPAPQPYGPPPYGQVVVMRQPYRSSTAHIVIAWIVAVLTAFYMLPWAIAATRNKSNTATIALINLFLGWSVIGWIAALVLSLTSEPAQTTVVVNQPVYPTYPPAAAAPSYPTYPPAQQAPTQIAPYQPYTQPGATEPTAILPPNPNPWPPQDDRHYDTGHYDTGHYDTGR